MNTCPKCSTPFACDQDATCWCQALPSIDEVQAGDGCQCQACTAGKIKAYLEDHPGLAASFRSKTQKVKKPSTNLVEGIDYEINESGFWVFTAYHHLSRGFCCQSGCLHCPYGYQKK